VLVPVISALAVGIGFIVIFGLISPLRANEHDRITFSLLDTGRIQLEGNDQLIIDVMLQNSTVVELLQGRKAHVSEIADMEDGCSFGSCARVHLWQDDKPKEQAQILVDYPNNRVVSIQYTKGW
jgi:hypothetical protein